MKVPLLATLTLLLCACSRPDKPPPQPSVAQPTAAPVKTSGQPQALNPAQALMRAIYGERFSVKNDVALARVHHPDGGDEMLRMTYVASTELPDGRTVAVVSGRSADEEGNDQSNMASQGIINVYFLKREGTAWQVLERREGVGSAGSHGGFGKVQWVSLAPERPGLLVWGSGGNRGQTVTHVEIFDLDGVKHLGGLIGSSDNSGACLDDSARCWEVEGALRFDADAPADPYWDILIDFTGREYAVDANGDEQSSQDIGGVARYRFDGEAYSLVEGRNPAQAY